jgi:hypothetical protein
MRNSCRRHKSVTYRDSVRCQSVKVFEVVEKVYIYMKQEPRCGESQTNYPVSDRI